MDDWAGLRAGSGMDDGAVRRTSGGARLRARSDDCDRLATVLRFTAVGDGISLAHGSGIDDRTGLDDDSTARFSSRFRSGWLRFGGGLCGFRGGLCGLRGGLAAARA
jgi:hypothetical protein